METISAVQQPGVKRELLRKLSSGLATGRDSQRSLKGRGIGLRAPTNFRVCVHGGGWPLLSKAIELSASGIVLERGPMPHAAIVRLEMFLNGRSAPILALARVVRLTPSCEALRFIGISDADRLTLMEHLDASRASS